MDKIFDFSEIFNFISLKFGNLFLYAEKYLSGLSNIRATAVILFLASLFSLLCLVIVWYIKTIITSIRNEKQIEREYQSKLDHRLNKKLVNKEDFNDEKESLLNNNKEAFAKTDQPYLKPHKNALPLDLDWKNKKSKSHDVPTPSTFEYQFKPQKLATLIGLIIDLLQRNVDEPKIAQTVMYKNQHLNSEDDVIQTITAIKIFIYLCVNGCFKNLEAHKTLPQEDAALFHLINGDCSLAIILLETLIDKKINEIKKSASEKEQDKAWCEVSNITTVLGTFATFHSLRLAQNSFELAIEMNPQNATAWGRLGDMYYRNDKQEKAVWAYNNVINIADEEIYTQQIANANKIMASYYNEIGRRATAENMLKNANHFYESIGINVPLTNKEIRIVNLVETRHFENIEELIESLFQNKNFQKKMCL